MHQFYCSAERSGFWFLPCLCLSILKSLWMQQDEHTHTEDKWKGITLVMRAMHPQQVHLIWPFDFETLSTKRTTSSSGSNYAG